MHPNECLYLNQAATKFAQSSQNMKDLKPVVLEDSALSDKSNETTQKNKK